MKHKLTLTCIIFDDGLYCHNGTLKHRSVHINLTEEQINSLKLKIGEQIDACFFEVIEEV